MMHYLWVPQHERKHRAEDRHEGKTWSKEYTRPGWNRGTVRRRGEPGLHPKRREGSARLRAGRSVRGRKGRSASRLFRDGISGRRRGSGDSGGVAGWKRERHPDRRDFQAAFHLPRDSVTRGIAPLPRAARRLICPFVPDPPLLPSARQALEAKVSV
ncbi:hypothetical protein PAL_GLEAN10019098 [Pteropus alecto]|uniref:Uncharacterized protein n=1 Tax=Pteropus alecto TaxID=9402 RepID=L5KPX2_PTEAL|nr:hypothetical protein PAL_GLEAN10019098 [Pteropus alecto]